MKVDILSVPRCETNASSFPEKSTKPTLCLVALVASSVKKVIGLPPVQRVITFVTADVRTRDLMELPR